MAQTVKTPPYENTEQFVLLDPGVQYSVTRGDINQRTLEDGRLDPERLATLDDDQARTELMQVKGVGRFTADGVLMLALRRPDVWPAADLAFRRAVERIWRLNAPASLEQVDSIGARFRRWRTLAATYLYNTA